MAEKLTFDQKIQGLADYYEQLGALNPKNMDADKKPPTYSSAINVVDGIRKAQASLEFDLGCHARVEYGERGFRATDLRDANAEEIRERAGVLAIMTAPSTPEAFFEGAARIEELLGKIVSGEELRIAEHFYDGWYFDAQSVAVDTSRPLFTSFNGHISGRDMCIQYDRDDIYGMEGPTEYALRVAIPTVVAKEIVTYPVAA